ncbi:MAG: RidA family protein [Halanaerobiales bacterium]|nr:RidA family protein [Halanaerobiales bacterium]
MKKIIKTEKAPAAIGSYSQAVKSGSTVYISGQIPLNLDGDLILTNITEQTEQVLTNLSAILEEAGGDFSNVVKATVYTDDIANFNKINQVYGKYFSENPPARAFVEVAALPKGVNVEIEAIAVI